MNIIRGYYRLSLAALSLSLGGTLIILTSWIPVKIKGFRPSFWILLATVRTVIYFLNIKVTSLDFQLFRQFDGFIFPNHVTYVDILVLISITPVRFLAKQSVRSWPVIGLIAQAIGCVFVKREDKDSRAKARAALAEVDTFPPIVLFPEGKRGPGDELLPFRYGAFEIVIHSDSPFLPCIIVYDQLNIAIWRRGEHVIKAIWRLVSHHKPIKARLIPLEVCSPRPDADPAQLSIETRENMQYMLQKYQPQAFQVPG